MAEREKSNWFSQEFPGSIILVELSFEAWLNDITLLHNM